MAQRKRIMNWVRSAQNSGARLSKIGEILGLSVRTFQRWQHPDKQQDGRSNASHQPANRLSEQERQQILTLVNQPDYALLPVSQIVPQLADQGVYIASESSFYRVLKAAGQITHRQPSRPAYPRAKPKAFKATGPNQLYSWDITYLATRIRGQFYYLYCFLDLFSRKIVGWQVYACESSAYASDLIRDICDREKVDKDQVVLHSDNGHPMKGITMLAMLDWLGITPSRSRPSVSNDNPYSEALFRTLKYRPNYPSAPFDDIDHARHWVSQFVHWYNTEHRHSAIGFVTPKQRHQGLDKALLEKRKQVYRQAKKRHPNRWSGKTRNWDRLAEVCLNPDKPNPKTINHLI